MSWLSRLFSGRRQEAAQQQEDVAVEFALAPPSEPGVARVLPPRERGRTLDKRKADWARYCKAMQAQGRAISKRDRENARAAGVTKYIWRSYDDADVCSRCASNNGKQFSWMAPPPDGHPGESESCPTGWCRCYAVTVITS